MHKNDMRDLKLSQEERDLIDAAVKAGKITKIPPGTAKDGDMYKSTRDLARQERAAFNRALKKEKEAEE